MVQQSILDRVEMLPDAPGCWLWLGSIDVDGYGHMGKTQLAHRVAYRLWIGDIPTGLTLDHLCRNRSCVNPAHLEAVTIHENIRRHRQYQWNAIKTHCKNGHPFDVANTWSPPDGRPVRICRQCGRDRKRKYRPNRSNVNALD